MEYVAHHRVQSLIAGTGIPLDLVWMVWNRTMAVDWARVFRTRQFPFRTFLRYDPFTDDIDGLPDRYGGDKFFRSTLRGSPVFFARVTHVDDLFACDWYDHETLRRYGEEAIKYAFRSENTPLYSLLENPPAGQERRYSDAFERRDHPFGRYWYSNSVRGVGVMTRAFRDLLTRVHQ